jgi:hypothetical protein
MKTIVRNFALSTFIIFTQTVNAQQHTVSDLAGRWESADGTTGSIEFIEGSKAVVSISGLQIPATSYNIDFSKDPAWFDVFVTPSRPVKGLLQFVDDNTIKWQIFLDNDRPMDFNDAVPGPVVLNRKK